MSATPAEARAARAFLFSHSKNGFGIKPRKFAASAKELNVGFRELLRFLGTRYDGGQNLSAERREIIRNQASKEK